MNNEEIMTGVELEIILKAGKILLSSGAEISRTEDTMNYIARAMNFKDLISILYSILGYMGLLLLIILIYG